MHSRDETRHIENKASIGDVRDENIKTYLGKNFAG